MRRFMQTLSVVAALSIVFPLLLSAQGDEIFKVIACKGKITLQRTQKTVSVGTALNSADHLQMDGPTYLGLVHKSGKAIELRQSGSIAIADLLKQVSSKQSGMDKLVGFVVQSVTGASENKNEMKSGVERSLNVSKLRLLAPRTSKLIDTDVNFAWNGSVDGKASSYTFVIKDANQNNIFTKEVSTPELSLNLKSLGLEKDRCYYWSVTQKDANTPSFESYCLYMMNDADKSFVASQLDMLRKEQGDKPTALDKLMLASFYEQNGLTYNAYTAYKEAVAMGGDVEIFADSYREFLRRSGMDFETIKLMTKN